MKKLLLLLGICLSGYSLLYAQGPVNVNPLTGTAQLSIPVIQISKGSVSVPISLNYSATGIKPKDVEGTAGIGWNLSVGGQVSRQLRGLPDDCLKDNAQTPNARLGWLNNNNGTIISNFSIANDNNTSTCPDETADINYINANFTGYSDTEPDIFSVSAPGLSCQLVFDKSKKLQVLSYQDIQASYVIDSGTGLITSFTIINDKGTRYVFGAPEMVTQQAITDNSAAITYFKNAFNQYQNGVNFYDNWFLTGITDVNGNTVSLTYDEGPLRASSNPVELYIGGSTTKSTQYTIQQLVAQKILSSITNGSDVLSFSWSYDAASAGGSSTPILNGINGTGGPFIFNYSRSGYLTSNGNVYKRLFLRNFNNYGCNSPLNYNFKYYGETPTNGSSGYDYQTKLSDSSSTFTDYWGYQNTNSFTSPIPIIYVNPSTPAYPRYTNYIDPASVGATYIYLLGRNGKFVDSNSIVYGSLDSIINVNGGITTLTYEPNDYLDVPTNTVIKGNGIRIKTITDNDGTGNSILRSYSYLDPVSGTSSGKPVTLPVYAFTIPYTGTATGSSYWDNATVISANDLSNDDHTIMYKYCKESKTGAGSILYQYYIPATVWDNSATPGCVACTTAEWTPTLTNVARPTCVSYGPIRNDTYTYPFAPAANYDMERGLVQKITNYNDAGTEVSEAVYSYQRTSPPLIIPALKFDDNNGVNAYAKYNLYANTSELTSQVTRKVFDSSTLSQAQSSATNYTYGNAYHQLIKQQTTNSDNSIVTVNTAYTKDYVIPAPGADSTVNAIYHLQNQNIDLPIETYTQVTRAGQTKTISAQLTKFKTFSFSGQYAYLPSQSLKLIAPNGTTFTPFSVTGGIATNDPQYIPSANYTAYDQKGILQTADDNYRHVQTAITDQKSNQTVASFKNAAVSDIGFEDFDSGLPSGTNYTLSVSTGMVSANSHTGNAYTFNTGQSISKSMTKKVGENYYILSAWISSSAAGNINLALTNSSNSTSTFTEPFTNTGGVSKYFEWKVPVNTMTPGFTMSLTTSQQIFIDDILFYPQTAEASTVAYDPVNHFKIAETNTNGVSAYYKNDSWGRLLFAYDQDKNIVLKRTYVTSSGIAQGIPEPFIYGTNDPVIATPYNFNVGAIPCITGITYTWNFGDGSPAVVSAIDVNSQTHTYNNSGNYTVTVTATHPTFGSKSSSEIVSVKPLPLAPIICASGVTDWDACADTAIVVATCGSNPTSNHISYYTVSSVGNAGSATLSYQWQENDLQGGGWVNGGTNSNQFSVLCTRHSQSYQVRCIVTSSLGQTGTSNTLIFASQTCSH
ncbi:PKD domain-containing protein [Mucilaginibacter sp. 22184]|uniref:PKD domain-containing protein n=1 Tax=Mucilaginibacter sp. 22184 TaxID=3453887 RepID=UPI003F833EB1